MFTVTGTIDGIPYRVGVHDEPVGGGELHGCVMGSDNATSLLTLLAGDEVQETPTHDPVVLSLDDPVSVLTALREHTSVISIEGDVPNTANLAGPGGVY